MIRYSHLLQNFPQFIVIHTVKGFGIVNKTEIDVFLELSWFFHDPADVGNLVSGSSAFSKTSLNIWKFMELKHLEGQGRRPRGATPRLPSSSCVGTGGPRGATPHSRSGGAAVRRYPSSKVRSSGCALLEQL